MRIGSLNPLEWHWEDLLGGSPDTSGIQQANIIAGANLANGLLASQTAKELQEKANITNIAEAQKNREYQTEMFGEEKKFNAEEAQKSRDFSSSIWDKEAAFNADQARIAREYETSMSGSAYQRATADMKAAGVNPMLAIMQGGANTPNVGSASVGSAPSASASVKAPGGSQARVEAAIRAAEMQYEAIRNALSNAIDIGRFNKDMQEKNASINLVNQNKETSKTVADVNRKTSAVRSAEVNKLNAETEIKRSEGRIKAAEAKFMEKKYDMDTKSYGVKWLWDNITQPISSAIGLSRILGR